MGTTIAITFPWGRYHATPWGRNVNEGAVDWPPAPWRLLRALYATWRHRAPDLDGEVVDRLLRKLSALPTYRVPEYTVAHTRHYMPDNKDGTDKVLDTFAVFPPSDPLVVRWPVDLEDDEAAALHQLCELLPYLGRAESVCEARVVVDEEGAGGEEWSTIEPLPPDSEEPSLPVLAPNEGLEGCDLTARPSILRRAGHVVPPGTQRVTYRSPQPSLPTSRRAPRRSKHADAARFAIVGPALPARTAAVAMCDVLRDAAMSRFGDLYDGAASPILAGKRPDGTRREDQHQHAHYLALSSNDDHAAGLLDTLVVWAPGGFGQEEIRALEALSGSLLKRGEYLSDFRPCRLGLEAIGAIADVAPELCKAENASGGRAPSRTWESFTPFAPARHGRRNQDWWEWLLAEVNRELAYRRLPHAEVEPLEAHRVPGLTRGWLDFRRHRVKERLRHARRATGVRLRFDEPQTGPISLGALSHFGLGLFLPVADPRSEARRV